MFDWLRNQIARARERSAILNSIHSLEMEMAVIIRSNNRFAVQSALVPLFFSEIRNARSAAYQGRLTAATLLRDEAKKSKAHVARNLRLRTTRHVGARRRTH